MGWNSVAKLAERLVPGRFRAVAAAGRDETAEALKARIDQFMRTDPAPTKTPPKELAEKLASPSFGEFGPRIEWNSPDRLVRRINEFVPGDPITKKSIAPKAKLNASALLHQKTEAVPKDANPLDRFERFLAESPSPRLIEDRLRRFVPTTKPDR